MQTFTYVSRDSSGQKVTAVAEAESRQELLTRLKEQGLTVVQVSEYRAGGEKDKKKTWFDVLKRPVGRQPIGVAELSIFWQEFAAMIGAGLSIIDAIQSISNELKHDRLKYILDEIVESMWSGSNFSQGLRKHEQVFSPMIVGLVEAAEEIGNLPEVSNQIATYLEKRDRLIRKVRAALAYPIFVTGFFLCVVGVATFIIVPKFREIYGGFNAKLPWITTVVFDANEIILRYLPWMACGAVLAVIGLIYWMRKRSGRMVMDRIFLKLPIFGAIVHRAAIARFCRSLAVLLFGGLPVNRAFEMVEETVGNTVVSRAVKQARQDIMEGTRIAESLKRQRIFPNMTVRMVSAGEETGNLSALLEKAADFYEARVDAALSTINVLIEPIIIIFIGAFVLIFVLALYMPIFTLGQSMRA